MTDVAQPSPAAPLILVVDDNAAALKATLRIVEKAGFRAAGATDGLSALAKVSSLGPDLVLLDVVLPDLEGPEVVKRIRANLTGPQPVVILLSAQRVDAHAQALGLDAGADGYISRPAATEELVARIRAHLRQRDLYRQLAESEKRYHDLISRQADGVLVVDGDGIVRFANNAAAQIFELPVEALLGTPFGFPLGQGHPAELETPRRAAPSRLLEMRVAETLWDKLPAHLVTLRDVTAQRRDVQALRESEERLHAVFQQAAAGICLASLEGAFLRVNRRFCEIVGYDEAELLTRDCVSTTHPEDRAFEAEMLEDLLGGETTSPSWEKRYLRRDGTVVWANLTLSLLRDDEGRPSHFIGVILDITVKKQAESLLARRARQQQAVARLGLEASRATSLDAVLQLATALTAEALEVELSKVLQLAPERRVLRLVAGVGWQAGLIGTATVGTDYESQAGYTLEEGGPIRVADLSRETRFRPPPLLTSHAVVSGMSVVIESRGRPWGVLGIHSPRAQVFTDEDSHFLQAVATLLSIVIERLASQQALSSSERRMRDAQRIAHLGNWELDLVAGRLSWSDEVYRIFGVEPAAFDASYEAFFRFVHPEDQEAMQGAQERALAGTAPLEIEHRIVRTDGSVRWVKERGELIRDETGRPVALTGTVLDVTDLREAQQAAEQTSVMLVRAQQVGKVGSWETDLATMEVKWSEQTHRIFETSPKTFAPSHAKFLEIVHPLDRAAVDEAFMASFGRTGINFIEHRLLFPDGRVKIVEERWEVARDSEERPIRATGTCQEITERRLAEQQVAASERRFRSIYEFVPVSIWEEDWSGVLALMERLRAEGITDLAQHFATQPAALDEARRAVRIVDVNEATLRLFEANTKAELTQSLGEIMRAPDAFPGFRDELLALCRGRTTHHAEVALRTLRGRRIHVQLSVSLPTPGTGSNSVLASLMDVTERVRAASFQAMESHLLEAVSSGRPLGEIVERLALGLEETVSDSVASVLLVDGDGKLRLGAAPHLPATLAQALVDRPPGPDTGSSGAAFHRRQPVVAADLASDPSWAQLRPLAQEAGLAACWSIPVLLADGSCAATIDLFHPETRSPQPEELTIAERLAHIVAIAIERDRRLEALRSSEERLQFALNSNRIGAWVLDLRNNSAQRTLLHDQIFGYAELQPEWNFAKFLEHVLPEDRAEVDRRFQAALSGRTRWDFECRIRRTDGAVRWIWATGDHELAADATPLRLSGLVQDITARREAEEERQRFFNMSLDMLCVAGFEGRFLQVNPAWTHCLGWSAEELVSRPWLDFVHPDDHAKTRDIGERLFRGEILTDFENRYLCKDGSVRWLSWTAHPLPEVRQLFAVGRDITQQRRNEERMRLLDASVSHLNDLVLITDLTQIDEPGPRIVYVNESFERLTGYTRAEALGRSPRFLQGPKTDRGTLDRIRAGLRDGTVVREQLLNYAKDGREYWVEIEVVPVPDAEGRFTHAIAIERDITERKHSEDALLRNQTLLRIAGHAARLGGWSLDLASQSLTWSEETCYIHEVPVGFKPPLAEGINFYPPEYRDMVTQQVTACLEEGAPFDFEAEIITARGRRLWVRAIGEAVRDASGKIMGMQGAFQDITPQKEAERSVAEGQRRFRELAESMPHIVWTAEADGTVDYSNREFFAYTGASPAEPPASRWQSRLHPDDLGPCEKLWAACVAAVEPYETEYRIRRGSDGQHRWFRVQAVPIRDSADRVVKWYGTAIDIHDTKDLERQATELARRLTTTLESLTDAFFTLDPEWRFTYVNGETETLLRRPRQDLLGNNVWDLFPEAVGSTFETQYRTAVGSGEAVAFEEYFPPLEAWFEVRAYPSTEGLAVYFRDVSERRRSRDELRVSEERFRLLARATNDAIWDWNLSTDALWWNEGFEVLFGYNRTEVEPTSASWERRIHPDDQARVLTGIRTAIEGGQETWIDEYRFRRKDGSHAFVLDRGHIIRNAEGNPVRMIGGMTDLTQRKQAEERLRQQADLLDKAQDAILVCDLDERITFWNRSAARILTWTREEALGRSLDDLFATIPSAHREAITITKEKGEWLGSIEHAGANGERVILDGRWTLVRDDAGQPVSILAILTDVTERKKIEQQFLRAQRMESIGTLAGGIAHDLNNLLAPIMLSVELLRGTTPTPQGRELVDRIEQSAKRGASLVKQVLSFARGVEGERITLQVRHLVKDVVSILEGTLPKNVEITTQLPTDLWAVIGDATQLHQVLLNLCVNARDAMPDGGRLTIKAVNREIDQQYSVMNRGVQPGDYMLVEVSDTGCGIPAPVLDRIFEPFFTTKEHGKGTGLGLSTVQAIIRSHGGFVNVYSEVGKGSVFRVYLPALRDPSADREGAPAHDRDPLPRGNGELILVVDDESSILGITRQTLEAFGYRVLCAQDGAQAIGLYAAQSAQISLVLTDMMMPVMDGPALIAAVMHLNPKVRIIAASGLNANSGPTKAASAGVKHFLPKPYSAAVMLRTIHEVLHPPG